MFVEVIGYRVNGLFVSDSPSSCNSLNYVLYMTVLSYTRFTEHVPAAAENCSSNSDKRRPARRGVSATLTPSTNITTYLLTYLVTAQNILVRLYALSPRRC